jgi:predicted RNase H-like HicB family nuclease
MVAVGDAVLAIGARRARRQVHRLLASCSPKAYHDVMDLQFTAVFRQVPEGYIGFVEELPGANTQGATLEEARANLQEAVAMIVDANRELAQQATGQGPVIREPLKVSA